jgi:hypothetical protein
MMSARTSKRFVALVVPALLASGCGHYPVNAPLAAVDARSGHLTTCGMLCRRSSASELPSCYFSATPLLLFFHSSVSIWSQWPGLFQLATNLTRSIPEIAG